MKLNQHQFKALQRAADPTVNDDINTGRLIGDLWANTTAKKNWVCKDNVAGAAVWIMLEESNWDRVNYGAPTGYALTPKIATDKIRVPTVVPAGAILFGDLAATRTIDGSAKLLWSGAGVIVRSAEPYLKISNTAGDAGSGVLFKSAGDLSSEIFHRNNIGGNSTLDIDARTGAPSESLVRIGSQTAAAAKKFEVHAKTELFDELTLGYLSQGHAVLRTGVDGETVTSSDHLTFIPWIGLGVRPETTWPSQLLQAKDGSADTFLMHYLRQDGSEAYIEHFASPTEDTDVDFYIDALPSTVSHNATFHYGSMSVLSAANVAHRFRGETFVRYDTTTANKPSFSVFNNSRRALIEIRGNTSGEGADKIAGGLIFKDEDTAGVEAFFLWQPTHTGRPLSIWNAGRQFQVFNNGDASVERDFYIKRNARVASVLYFDTAQTTAPLTEDGVVYYNTSLNQFQFREDGEWKSLGGNGDNVFTEEIKIYKTPPANQMTNYIELYSERLDDMIDSGGGLVFYQNSPISGEDPEYREAGALGFKMTSEFEGDDASTRNSKFEVRIVREGEAYVGMEIEPTKGTAKFGKGYFTYNKANQDDPTIHCHNPEYRSSLVIEGKVSNFVSAVLRFRDVDLTGASFDSANITWDSARTRRPLSFWTGGKIIAAAHNDGKFVVGTGEEVDWIGGFMWSTTPTEPAKLGDWYMGPGAGGVFGLWYYADEQWNLVEQWLPGTP